MQKLVKGIRVVVASAMLAIGLLTFSPALSTPVHAGTSQQEAEAGINATGAASGLTVPRLIENVILLLSYLVGAVAVIMLVVGGFSYVTSQGDSGKLNSAKNTILYAIVGIVIVLFAQVIVRFVVAQVT